MTTGEWVNQLVRGVGGYISLETLDGMRRTGRLTAIKSRTIVVNQSREEFPEELEINGDPTDIIELARIQSIVLTEGT